MRFLSLITLVQLLPAALAACTDVADGFASLNGGTTGGNGGTVVTVSNQADLVKYASAAGKYIVKVSGKITITPKGYEVRVASDKTIIGVGSNAEIAEGGFFLGEVKNVIIRNLRIGKTYVPTDWEGKTQDWDGIQAVRLDLLMRGCLLTSTGYLI